MSKEQYDTHLRYGQGILIKGFKTTNDIGFLTAKGFADIRARYETYDDILYFKNYRNAIFQIIPAGSFDLNDQLQNYLENNFEPDEEQLKILRAKAKSEKNQFQLTVNSKVQNKTLVCFGDDIVLKHIDSEAYLSGTINPSEGTNGAFNVILTKNLATSLIFRLLPFRSFDKLTSPIPLDSPVKILNIRNKGYLTFEKFGIKRMGKNVYWDKSPLKSDDSYKIPVKTESTSSEIYEVVTHFGDLSVEEQNNVEEKPKPMPWNFQLHFQDVENDSLIQHDIVFFRHTENGGVLSAAGQEQIILKEMKGQLSSELQIYDCLWEIETYHEKNPNSYILRHLISGMTLGVEFLKRADGSGIPIRPKLIDISDGKGDGTIDNLGFVELVLAKKEGGIISSDRYINICCGKSCLDIVQDKEKDKTKRESQNTLIYELDPSKTSKNQENIDMQKLNAMRVNQYNFVVKKVEFTTDISKHCFKIQEIQDSLKKEVLFALSFHSRLIELRQDLKWGAEQSRKKIGYLKMLQVTEKIKQIKDFLKNCDPDDPYKEFLPPRPKQQRICFDLGLCELLFQLLSFLRKNKDGIINKDGEQQVGQKGIFHDSGNQLQKFNELYNSVYEVIYELIKDNPQVKIHVTQWISFILKDMMIENQKCIMDTLLELLKENSFFVNNFVTQKLVNYLVKQMIYPGKKNEETQSDFTQIKYIEVFRAFCICGKEVNSDNQVIILENFIKKLQQDQREWKKFNIKFIKIKQQPKQDGEGESLRIEACVDKNKEKARPFVDFYKICIQDYPSAWDYFVAFLNLLADMVQGRNKIVEKFIEQNISLDFLTNLLQEKLQEAEVPVIRLLHYLYAEGENYYSIEKIVRINNYEDIGTKPLSINKLKILKNDKGQDRITPPKVALGQAMTLMLKKLSECKSISIDPKRVKDNKPLYVILGFVKQTMNLGFWDDRDEIKIILHNIQRILQVDDGSYVDTSKQSQNPDIILMVQCKEKCMEILQLVIDYDMDYSMKIANQTFRDFEIPKVEGRVDINTFLETKQATYFGVDFVKQYAANEENTLPFLDIEICKSMIQIAKHNHPRLTSFSLQILQKILESKKNKIQLFYNQIYICERERREIASFIEERRNKFFTIEYQNTTKVTQKSQENLYHQINKPDVGLMQDLYKISQIIKNESSYKKWNEIRSLDQSGYSNFLAQKTKLLNFTQERRSSDNMKQQVVCASNIHLKVLKYVFNCRQIPESDLARKLLHLSYRFLVSIIENYQEIKVQLQKQIPNIIHHVQSNLGCIDFLKQMYDNNKNLLYNEVEINKLIKNICNTIEQEQITTSHYKAKLLDFFRYLIYCNGRALNDNQITIMKIMQDDSYSTIILAISEPSIKPLVDEYKRKNKDRIENETLVIEIQPELNYMITYFQIMISLIDDGCKVNAGKLVKKFPFDKLVEYIKIADTCWPLKRNIRGLLNRLYYCKPDILSYSATIIKDEIDNIITDLNEYILVKCKTNAEIFENQYFQNPVRFSYLQSYLYLNFEENLFSLYYLLETPKLREELERTLHKSEKEKPYKFIRICERLSWIRNYFKKNQNIFSNSFIRHILKKLRDIISEFDDSIYEDGMKVEGDDVLKKSEKEEEREKVIERIFSGEISTAFVQNAASIYSDKPIVYDLPNKIVPISDNKQPNNKKLMDKLRVILTRKKRQFNNEDDRVYFQHLKMVNALKLDEHVKQILKEDYNLRLGSVSELAGQSSIFDYIKANTQIYSTNPGAFSTELKIFFLGKITGIIQNQNKTVTDKSQAIDEWEASQWSEYVGPEGAITKMQNRLKKTCKVSTLLAEMLRENIVDDIPLANAIFLCSIAYLLGGNQVTQDDLIDQIKTDPDGRVFKNISDLISKLGRLIIKNIDESNYETEQGDQFKAETIDNYDFYDTRQKYVCRKNVKEPNSTDDAMYHLTCIDTYRRAFKFLQLLCENNNTENQNYIRDQPKKMNNINFITAATNELRNMFSAYSKSIRTVPLNLMDFLSEVTQIPAKENQKALVESSFFEDLCQMSDELSQPEKVASRGFAEGESPIKQIIAKCIEMILKIFEGNSEKQFFRLDSKLDPNFLVYQACSKLTELGIKTKRDLLKHLNDPTDENGNKIVRTDFSEQIKNTLDILIIYFKLRDKLRSRSRLYPIYEKMKKNNKEEIEESVFTTLENLLISIQIVDKDRVKQTIYFPKYPVFNSLSGSLRDFVMDSVKRQTHREKIVSLIGYIPSIRESINYSYKMQKLHNITEENLKSSYSYATNMSIIICIFMMLYYDVIVEYHEADFTSTRLITLTRMTLSLIQLSMVIVYSYYWYILKIWQKPVYQPKEDPNKLTKEQKQKKAKMKNLPLFQKFIHCLKVSMVGEEGGANQKDETLVKFLRLVLFLSTSFFGTFFYPTLFFIHIIDIVCNSDTLANIFKAVAKSLESLIYVSFMGVVFVLIFCTVTFSNYMKNVYEEETDEMCDSMLSCIMALYVSGAIGETMDKFEIIRFGYDMIYGIFFGLLFGNIVSGLILDAFAKLREDTDSLKGDKENFCFICNISRDKLEKDGSSLEEHIKSHWLWNYVFYIIAHGEKEKTEYTGLQYYIGEQYDQTDEDMKINWIPDGQEVEYDQCEGLKSLVETTKEISDKIEVLVEDFNLRCSDFKSLMGEIENNA